MVLDDEGDCLGHCTWRRWWLWSAADDPQAHRGPAVCSGTVLAQPPRGLRSRCSQRTGSGTQPSLGRVGQRRRNPCAFCSWRWSP